jgi:excisionase family DNA binding protein
MNVSAAPLPTRELKLSDNRAARRAKKSGRRSKAPAADERPMAWRIDDGARLLSLSRSTIYALARDGRLRLIRIAGRTLIPDSEVVRLAAEGA